MQITTQAQIDTQNYRLARLIGVIEEYRLTDPDIAAMALHQARAVNAALVIAKMRKGGS